MKINKEVKRYNSKPIGFFSMLTGIVVAGVVFGTLSPWWLCAGVFTSVMALGVEFEEVK